MTFVRSSRTRVFTGLVALAGLWLGASAAGCSASENAASAPQPSLLDASAASDAANGTTSDAGAPADASPSADASTPKPVAEKYASAALKMADYLLAQQTPEGAIVDSPGGLVNEDSNMQYALIGLAAAYWYSHEPRYLTGLERGIRWLAAREEMTDPSWKGSWMYTYRATPPYAPVPTSPAAGISDVRGVDATSGLFVYLVSVHAALSGSNALATELQPNAQAAIDFLMAHNKSAQDAFFLSSWQKKGASWTLWPYEYAADQGDVYLGLRGYSRLYEASNGPIDAVATALESELGVLFDAAAARYSLGRDEGAGELDDGFDGFDGIFPNGYLPWIMGNSANNLAAFHWLEGGVQADGSLSLYAGDPKYTLSAAVFAMAAAGIGQPVPTATADWLVSVPYDAASGSVRDTAAADSEPISNVVGFSIVGLLGFPAL